MRDVPEQLVQLAHALLDVADLGLALDDQRVLEVDLVLRGQAELVLRLLRLRLQMPQVGRLVPGRGGVLERAAGGGGRGALPLQGLALDVLEFAQ